MEVTTTELLYCVPTIFLGCDIWYLERPVPTLRMEPRLTAGQSMKRSTGRGSMSARVTIQTQALHNYFMIVHVVNRAITKAKSFFIVHCQSVSAPALWLEWFK